MAHRTHNNWNEERARNWRLFVPPARPSKGEMAQYERIVLSENWRDSTAWALLGSTPEIRSLAALCQRELLCIESNAGVFHALKAMVDPKYSEVLMCSDWLTAEVTRPLDVVFADGSINMLARSKHEALVSKVCGMLKSQGRAIMRVHVAEPPEFSSPREVFEWYRSSNTNEPVFSATRTHLDMLWVEPESLKISFPDYHRKIQQLHSDGAMTDKEFHGYNELLQFNKIDLYYTTREDFECLASKYFDIEGVSYGKDYTRYMNHPVYELRKRVF